MSDVAGAGASPPARPPDLPPVPRAGMTMAGRVLVGVAVLVVGGYVALAATQRELTTAEKDEIPGSVRSSPGGYRSYSFWYSGYHGGK